jgi:hypothetical protein
MRAQQPSCQSTTPAGDRGSAKSEVSPRLQRIGCALQLARGRLGPSPNAQNEDKTLHRLSIFSAFEPLVPHCTLTFRAAPAPTLTRAFHLTRALATGHSRPRLFPRYSLISVSRVQPATFVFRKPLPLYPRCPVRPHRPLSSASSAAALAPAHGCLALAVEHSLS